MNIGLEYIEYALTFNLFELHRPLQLGYLVNASANEDNFQLRFTPPGLPDTIVIEGTLDKLRVYLRDPDDPQLFYPGFAYLVKNHVFLFTDTNIDEWFTEQFAEFGCVTDWRHKGMTPCWIPIERFWGHQHQLGCYTVVLETADFFGHRVLRNAKYGRVVDPSTIIHSGKLRITR